MADTEVDAKVDAQVDLVADGVADGVADAVADAVVDPVADTFALPGLGEGELGAREGGLPEILVIACGALAHELVALRKRHSWTGMKIRCLPAELHNRPERIPAAVEGLIAKARADGVERIFVAYADCGTGGMLDKVLERTGIERLPGAHCYAFFRGVDEFNAEHDDDPTCFYVTDFIARHFDRLIWEGLGMKKHPELRDLYFGNYTRAIYLSQQPTDALRLAAKEVAVRLGLLYEERHTGLNPFDRALARGIADKEGKS